MDDATIQALIEAASEGKWAVLAGIVLMVLVWLIRTIVGTTNIPTKYAPLFTQGLAMIAALGATLFAGVPWLTALLSALLVGGVASGFWSLVGKLLLPEITKRLSHKQLSHKGDET